MSWHYYNDNGEKIGPITGEQLIELARQGTIERKTRLVDPQGRTGLAEQLPGRDGKGLPFSEEIPVDWSGGAIKYKLYEHIGWVKSVAFSPDGKRIASAGDSTVRIWDATLEKVAHILWHFGNVWSIAFSPDGKQIASASEDKTVRIWNAATGMEVHILRHTGKVYTVAFSPDGKQIASICEDRTIRIWDVAMGKEVQRWRFRYDYSIALDRKQKYVWIVTCNNDQTPWIWDAATGKIVHMYCYMNRANSVAFSPDGKWIASAGSGYGSGGVIVWIADTTTGKELHRLEGHTSEVTSVAFSPDGKWVASASKDVTIRIWDVATGNEVHKLTGHTDIRSIVFSPDGNRVVTASNETVWIWDAVEPLLAPFKKENTIAAYEAYLYKYPNAPNRNKALTDMYKLVKKENTIATYTNYYSKYPSAPNRNEAVTDMYKLVKKENTIAAYGDFYSTLAKHPNTAMQFRNNALEGMYELVKRENTITAYETYLSNYPDAPNHNDAFVRKFDLMYEPVKKENTITAYADYYSKYPNAPNRSNALADMYELVKKENTITAYADYYSKYPNAPNRNNALLDMYELIKKENTIPAYADYYSKYPNAPNRSNALADMYELVKKENTVACYAWFLVNFSDAPQAAGARLRMNAEAFKGAKQINTVEALNDFIIAYPLAREVSDAFGIAYNLEKIRYAPVNNADKEEKARMVLHKLLRLWLDSKKIEPPERRLGYALVVNRMTQLLENEFPGQTATTEILTHEVHITRHDEMLQSLGIIQQSLLRLEDAVHQNTHQTAALIRQQTSAMIHYFGIMEDALHGITFATQSAAGLIANTLNRHAHITQSAAGQIASTLNRHAQSQEYHNLTAQQFMSFVQTKRYEDEQRMIGYNIYDD